MAKKKGIQLENYTDDNLPGSLDLDYQKLNQIIINLIGNSIKFTAKGRVVIKTTWHKLYGDNVSQAIINNKIKELKRVSSREDIVNSVEEFISLTPQRLNPFSISSSASKNLGIYGLNILYNIVFRSRANESDSETHRYPGIKKIKNLL